MWTMLSIALAAGWALTLWLDRRRRAGDAQRLERETAESASLREQLQQLQTEAQSRLQALFDSMIEAVLVLDASGRIELANEAVSRVFGTTGDLRGRTLIEAFRLDALQQVAGRVLTEGRVLNQEMELPGLDARCLQVNATRLLDRDGQPRGMILVFHDLTRVRQLENTRKEFVANVSHELRTPLSIIKGYAETLLGAAKDDPTVSRRFLQTIEKHADRLTYLIEDLLAVSRLESGQVLMNIQPLDLAPVVAEVLDDLRPRAEARQVSLQPTVPSGLFVAADADRLQQVLFNLVDNAIKYGRPGGRVTLSAGPRADAMIEVCVADDGPGIPAGAIDRLFERFYRVDKARSREQGGTGLGLAIVKHIVQFHGGEVRVASDPGQGARFYFTLPPPAPGPAPGVGQ